MPKKRIITGAFRSKRILRATKRIFKKKPKSVNPSNVRIYGGFPAKRVNLPKRRIKLNSKAYRLGREIAGSRTAARATGAGIAVGAGALVGSIGTSRRKKQKKRKKR